MHGPSIDEAANIFSPSSASMLLVRDADYRDLREFLESVG